MNDRDTAADIRRLLKEKNAVLLAHNYQRAEIQELADILADSLDLARYAARTDKPLIVFCGVRFMAETADILSGNKTVLLPRQDAGCPMARMADTESLLRMKKRFPGAMVVTYVNSTAEVKAESDICCTSANAVRVVNRLTADEIIFAPDRNLAHYVQRFTSKRIIPWDGYCYVHNRITADDVKESRKHRPDAVLMVHPECPPEVIDLADEVQSTGGMVRVAQESKARRFLIGTEEGMITRLKRENPGKEFYSVGPARLCRGMKTTRLKDLRDALEKEQHRIVVPEPVKTRARRALEKMLNEG